MPSFQLPHPVFPSIQYIKLYTLSKSRNGPTLMTRTGPHLYGSLLAGQRTISDFFKILDHAVRVLCVIYKLHNLDNALLPSAKGGQVTFEPLCTFFNVASVTTEITAELAAKHDGGESTTCQQSIRDHPDDSQGFTKRLIHRDKGCVACLAAGAQPLEALYLYFQDSNRFSGCHLIDLVYHDLWDAGNFSTLVTDPFTDPADANNQYASSSTRMKTDHRQMNSLENGILPCLNHHQDYVDLRFAIHPETHKIFSFYPTAAKLQDLEVKAPWDNSDATFPPPHAALLDMHYRTSMANAMKAN